jgi:methyl coenzyme M reductase gamma subunit
MPTKNWNLRARLVSAKFPGQEKTSIPPAFQENAASAGAERRLVAEVVNSAATGDRETFMQILSELGFGPNVIKNMANRYVPEIIEYNPGRLELP